MIIMRRKVLDPGTTRLLSVSLWLRERPLNQVSLVPSQSFQRTRVSRRRHSDRTDFNTKSAKTTKMEFDERFTCVIIEFMGVTPLEGIHRPLSLLPPRSW